MFKKVLAAILAVSMILLAFGCGQKQTGESTEPARQSAAGDGQKIAIIIGEQAQNPELFAAVSEIARTYDNSIMIVKYAANYYADPEAVTNIAQTIAGDENVQAIIFADGVYGTGAAVQKVHAMRPDLSIAVCNPHEGSVNMKGASFVLSVDFPALGEAMVKQAKDMGAENFVLYTTNRHLKYSSVVALRKAAEDACKAQKMTFKLASSIDRLADGRDLDTAKLFIAEDAARKNEKFGEKTALVSTDAQVQGAVAKEALRYGMFMPGTFLPSPLSIAADLGVDLTGHETDSQYAHMQMYADSGRTPGHIATWGFSAPIAFVQTALDWAINVVGGAGKATSVDDVQKLLSAHTADQAVTVTTDANGAYLVQSEAHVL